MKVMTPEFDSRIADWLEDDPDKAPSIVLETVVGALPSIPQRRTWRSVLRLNQMPRFSIAAVAILVAAVGFSAWIASNRGGTGSVPPTPTPTAVPTQTPAPSPRVLTGLDQALVMPAGTYRAGSPFSVPLTVSLPGNWGLGQLEANVLNLYKKDGNAGITVIRPTKVFRDACHVDDGKDAPSTVEGFEAALKSLPYFVHSDTSDAPIDGRPVVSFILNRSIDAWEFACDSHDLSLVTYDRFGLDEPLTTYYKGHNHIYLMEVGGEPVLIDGQFIDWGDPEVQEMEDIIKSIAFD